MSKVNKEQSKAFFKHAKIIRKENHKVFLKEALIEAYNKIILLELEVQQLRALKLKEEEIIMGLSEQLLAFRTRFFASHQERAPNQAVKKKKKQDLLPHNQNKNKNHIKEEIMVLECVVVEHELPKDSSCLECGGLLNEGMNWFEESSEIDVVERHYIIKRHKRKKYSCSCCKKIVVAPGGVKLTAGGQYSIEMAVTIACDKFERHLPLERQHQQMLRDGLSVDVKTLFNLTKYLYGLLLPVYEKIRVEILDNDWIHMDESPFTFYNPEKESGYVWSLSNQKGAYYRFEPSRAGIIAKEMMKGFIKGCVMTDVYSGYNFLDEMIAILHAFCWSHVRRKFFEAINNYPQSVQAVKLIDDLYDIEHEAKTMEEVLEVRQLKSVPVMKEFDAWILSMDGKYLPSSALGKAIHYYEERKKGLRYFLENANVPIDNNIAERRQRCPVMGRNNFLHFKSIDGADIGVFFYSIIESCKTNGLNSKAYMMEMAYRSARGEEMETPYAYASRMREDIQKGLNNNLELLKAQYVKEHLDELETDSDSDME